MNPYEPINSLSDERAVPARFGSRPPVYAWLVTFIAVFSHACMMGIGFIGKLIPESWTSVLLLGLLLTSTLFSVGGFLLIRRPLAARVLCGLCVLVTCLYLAFIIWILFFFELPGQD